MKDVIIKTKNLCKDYKMGINKVNILKDINLEIYKGDFTVIMGSSGSGKSTLLYSLSSMDKPSSGSVEITGKKISDFSDQGMAELRKKAVSFVFQNINLITDLTAFENISYPAYMVMTVKEANKRAETLLEEFGLKGERDKYPNEMSGGQQQRVAVARAIAPLPDIIFGDELTGALNSSSGIQVLDLLSKFNESGQSIVMVTHDIKACARGNRLLYLKDGQVAGDLNLGKYEPEKQEEREEHVFRFLKANGW